MQGLHQWRYQQISPTMRGTAYYSKLYLNKIEMIAFLHTSKIHINRFEELVNLIDKNIPTKHFVNEKLLESAIKNGKTDSDEFKKQINLIEKDHPQLIICTCSTYGEESDKLGNVFRIDRPIVQYIVSKFRRIGLAYTATSTKEISTNLLHETSKQMNKDIEIISCDCSEHWVHFVNGNQVEYEAQIANSIKLIENQVDVIFLAQASMVGAKNNLLNFKTEIVSCPEYGVKQILKGLSISVSDPATSLEH